MMNSPSLPFKIPPPIQFVILLLLCTQIFGFRMIMVPYMTFLMFGWIISYTTSAYLLLPHKQPMIDRIRYGLSMFDDILLWYKSGHIDNRDALRIKVTQIMYFTIRFMTLQPILSYLWLIDEILYSDYRRTKIIQPVFALTAPRSGSTSFHRTLALDDRFVSPYFVEFVFPFICVFRMINYLQENFPFIVHSLQLAYDQWKGVDRPMEIFHDLQLMEPEADEFTVAEYHLIHIQAMLTMPVAEVLVRNCRVIDESDNRRTFQLMDSVMKKVMYMRGGVCVGVGGVGKQQEKKRLLYRSHRSSRFEDFHKMYPDATYVGIIRNPADMVRSISSFMRAMTLRRSFCDIFGDIVVANKKKKDDGNTFQTAESESSSSDRTTDLTTMSGGLIAVMSDLFGAEADLFGGNVEVLKDRAYYITFPRFKEDPIQTMKDLYKQMNIHFTKQFEDSIRMSLDDHMTYKERYRYQNLTFDDMAVNETKFYEISNVKRYATLLERDVAH